MALAEVVMTGGSFAGSAALSAVSCAFVAHIFKLSPARNWRAVGLTLGSIAGLALTPLSLVTFGMAGAYLASLAPRALALAVMSLSVPAAVSIGAALAAAMMAVPVFGAMALTQRMLGRCPIFGNGDAAS